jgi:CheY-like chemotaxis protein
MQDQNRTPHTQKDKIVTQEKSALAAYKILVVDDEVELKKVLARDFERLGFTVLTADSAKSALDVLGQHSIHLIVSDVQMPGGSGTDLYEECLATLSSPPPFIFVTGLNAKTGKLADIEKTGVPVFPKPYPRDQLISCVMEKLKIEKK